MSILRFLLFKISSWKKWVCPNNLIYYTTDVYLYRFPYGEFIWMYLFFLSVRDSSYSWSPLRMFSFCENLFLSMIICENLFELFTSVRLFSYLCSSARISFYLWSSLRIFSYLYHLWESLLLSIFFKEVVFLKMYFLRD